MTMAFPKRVLVIAPIGAYMGRVKSGVKWALSRTDVTRKKVEVNLVFVRARTWAGIHDEDYEKAVASFIQEFKRPELAAQFKKFTVDTQTLDIDDEIRCTVWLVRALGPFLGSAPEAAAFIDMTSAPKEWLFACHYVAELFGGLCFYFVKSQKTKMPGDFTQEERADEGLLPETVILSGPDPTLSKWATKDTDNWMFFNCLCNCVHESYKRKQGPVLEIAIGKDELASKWKSYSGIGDESDAQRSVSHHLTAVSKFGLFVEEMGTIRLSPRGYALGLALGIDLPKESEDPEDSVAA